MQNMDKYEARAMLLKNDGVLMGEAADQYAKTRIALDHAERIQRFATTFIAKLEHDATILEGDFGNRHMLDDSLFLGLDDVSLFADEFRRIGCELYELRCSLYPSK